jgi:hypothetical protein
VPKKRVLRAVVAPEPLTVTTMVAKATPTAIEPSSVRLVPAADSQATRLWRTLECSKCGEAVTGRGEELTDQRVGAGATTLTDGAARVAARSPEQSSS